MSVWDQEWLAVKEEGERRVPALDYLIGLPENVRKRLLEIVVAVRYTGPDQWRDRQTHKPMRGDMDKIHEARDKHGETLYRLFLRWQRDEKRVVLLDGRTKDNNTTISDKEYEKIEKLAELADGQDPPFLTADDAVKILLDLAG